VGCECEGFSALGGGGSWVLGYGFCGAQKQCPHYGGAFVSLHSGTRCWIDNAGVGSW